MQQSVERETVLLFKKQKNKTINIGKGRRGDHALRKVRLTARPQFQECALSGSTIYLDSCSPVVQDLVQDCQMQTKRQICRFPQIHPPSLFNQQVLNN